MDDLKAQFCCHFVRWDVSFRKKKNLPTEKGKMHKGHQGEVGSKYQGQQTATKLHSGTPKTLLPK